MRRSRRRFLGTGIPGILLAAAAPTFVPLDVLGRGGAPGPNSRVGIGVIGNGPRGLVDLHGAMADPRAQIVAVSDVHEPRMREARWRVNKHLLKHDWSWGCAMHADYRQLLGRKDVDGVIIATPDHWHVFMAIDAIQAGKDLYLEKPMGLSLGESQALRKAIQGQKRVFQFGTQQRSSREFQKAVALVRNGRLGRLTEINVWALASRTGGSTAPSPVPAGLDYDAWLGPAPRSPHWTGKCQEDPASQSWLNWWFHTDYCLGFIAGWGIHPADIAAWGYPAMFDAPFEVEGRGTYPTEGACNTASDFHAIFRFPDGVQLHFRGYPNPAPSTVPAGPFSDLEKRYRSIASHGTAFEGREGWVRVHRGGIEASPEGLIEETLAGAPFRPHAASDHYRDWIDAIQSRGPTAAGFDDAFKADLLCHVADIACRLGRKLRFDPKTEKFIDAPDANARIVARTPRAPYKLPA